MIRQAIDRCSNIWASLPGAGYGQFGVQGWQPDCKIQRSEVERSERLSVSRVTAIISAWLSASSSACHGLLIITVITPLPIKPERDKNARELKLANAANYSRYADASAWCCCAWCKYTKELADAKAGKWCSAWWCCRWSSSVAHQQSVSQCVKPPRPPAWIMQPPPDWQTLLNGIISPSERGWSLCKNKLGRELRSILMSSDRVCPYRWATHAITVYTLCFQWV